MIVEWPFFVFLLRLKKFSVWQVNQAQTTTIFRLKYGKELTLHELSLFDKVSILDVKFQGDMYLIRYFRKTCKQLVDLFTSFLAIMALDAKYAQFIAHFLN